MFLLVIEGDESFDNFDSSEAVIIYDSHAELKFKRLSPPVCANPRGRIGDKSTTASFNSQK